MSLKQKRQWLFGVMMVLLVLNALPLQVVFAQQSTPSEVEDSSFTGTLEEMGDNFIVVSGMTFDTTNAVFDDEGTLEVGVTVKVEFIFDGEVASAISVELLAAKDDDSQDDDANDDHGDAELVGILEELGDETISVSGLTINITSAAIEDDLEIGDLVEVEFENAEGIMVAIEVSHTDDDDNCSIEKPEDWTTYTVEHGDTLSGIAVASNTNLDDLINVNCITNPSNIAVGTILFVAREITGEVPGWGDNDDDDDSDDDDHGDDDGQDDSGDDDNGNDDDDDNDDNGGDDDSDDDNGSDDDDDDNDDDDDDDNDSDDDNGSDDDDDDSENDDN